MILHFCLGEAVKCELSNEPNYYDKFLLPNLIKGLYTSYRSNALVFFLSSHDLVCIIR